MRNHVTKQLGEETKISQALIESLMENNREISLVDQEILDVEPQEYKVGNNLLTEPVGISADRIEGRYLNIIAHHTLKARIEQCFKQTKYEIADYFLSPMATANVVLTDSENVQDVLSSTWEPIQPPYPYIKQHITPSGSHPTG